MQSHESIQRAIGGKTIEHAKRQGKSTSSIYKWQEPSTDFTDSGTTNPVDRVERIVETAISLGNEKDAFSPLDYLEHRFNRVAITLPQLTGSNDKITTDLLKMIEEFGTLSRDTSAALADDRITRAEARQIEDDGRALVQKVMQFVQHVKTAASR